MLPPPFLDYLLMRGHVDGVMLTGCRDGACRERLGIDWTRQRIDGERDPYLRARVPRSRLTLCFVGPDRSAIERELDAFRARLRAPIATGATHSTQPPNASTEVN